MSKSAPDLTSLSPEEKRALLAEMLRQKAAAETRTSFTEAALNVRDQYLYRPGVVGQDLSGPEMAAEAVLDPAVIPEGPIPTGWNDPQQVLLTGATGFLGAHVLRELLVRTRAVVHCLVRADSPALGAQRLRQSLAERELWDDAFRDRVVPVWGDLSQPRAGLSEADFEALADQVDAVYHVGALVNFLANYAALRASNVQGTVEVLRLACRRRTKPVHLVSSFSVVPVIDYVNSGLVPELDDLDPGKPVQGGYVQSKWVSEKLAHAARDRGVPLTTYRPGMITGNSHTGVCNLEDLFSRGLRGCVDMRMAPAVDMQVDLSPVDYVASAVVHLSRQPASVGRAFHLVNPRSMLWSEVLAEVRAQGYPLQEVPYAVWHQLVASQPALPPAQNPLSMLAPLFPVLPERCTSRVPRMRFDVRRTEAGLAGSGIVCPPPTASLVGKYVKYLARCGFLPAAPQPGYSLAGGTP